MRYLLVMMGSAVAAAFILFASSCIILPGVIPLGLHVDVHLPVLRDGLELLHGMQQMVAICHKV